MRSEGGKREGWEDLGKETVTGEESYCQTPKLNLLHLRERAGCVAPPEARSADKCRAVIDMGFAMLTSHLETWWGTEWDPTARCALYYAHVNGVPSGCAPAEAGGTSPAGAGPWAWRAPCWCGAGTRDGQGGSPGTASPSHRGRGRRALLPAGTRCHLAAACGHPCLGSTFPGVIYLFMYLYFPTKPRFCRSRLRVRLLRPCGAGLPVPSLGRRWEPLCVSSPTQHPGTCWAPRDMVPLHIHCEKGSRRLPSEEKSPQNPSPAVSALA